MNPRAIRDFFTSKFGLFVVFVLAAFGGLFIYGKRDANERHAAGVSRSTKKVELGQMRAPLSQGLEDGVPQKAEVSDDGKSGIVAFRPLAMTKTEPRVAREKAAEKPRKVRYRTLLASYNSQPVAQE